VRKKDLELKTNHHIISIPRRPWRPRVTIILLIFYDKNYDLWEMAIRMTLKSKNKLAFIEGSFKKPILKGGDDPSKANA